jgi:hypothetical protein
VGNLWSRPVQGDSRGGGGGKPVKGESAGGATLLYSNTQPSEPLCFVVSDKTNAFFCVQG